MFKDAVLSAWAIAIAILVVWIAMLWAVKRRLFVSFRRRKSVAESPWLDSLLAGLSPALNVAIVVAGVALVAQACPLSARWRSVVAIAVDGGVVAALIVFADQAMQAWTKRWAERFPLLGESHSLVTGALRGAIIALGLLMFLEAIGVPISPILASLGIGSLAIALALQETAKNLFAGFFVIADKPLQVGDFVKLEGGQEGWLSQLGWRSSKFRMLADSLVVVPNSKLVDSVVTNYRAADGGLAISVELAVASGSDLERVERITIDAAREAMRTVEGAMDGFEPFVRFHTVAGGQISFSAALRARSGALIERVRHEFIKRLAARYLQEGIKIP